MEDDRSSPLSGYVQQLQELYRPFEAVWRHLADSGFRWDRELMLVLLRQLKAIAECVQRHDDVRLQEWVGQLRHHVQTCIGVGRALLPEEEGRLRLLLEQFRMLCRERCRLGEEELCTTSPAPQSRRRCDEVFVVGSESSQKLVPALVDAGYRVRCLALPEEAQQALTTSLPQALIVQLDDATRQAGLQLARQLTDSDHGRTPVFFITRQETLEARLEAVQAGGMGYFTRPLDINALVAKLGSVLFSRCEHGARRVLLVGTRPALIQRLENLFEIRGMQLRVTAPVVMLSALRQFRPDLLLVDLEGCGGFDGLALASVLRQHQDSYTLPLLLLCSSDRFPEHLARIGRDGDDLLSDDLPDAYLGWVVERRLQRAQAVNQCLTLLRSRDSHSGLFNRRYFLTRLEQALTQPRLVGGQELAVMLVMLRNWRELRERLDLASSDELLRQVARRLSRLGDWARETARVGDTLFALLVRAADQGRLLARAREIVRALEQHPYRLDEQPVTVESCVGIGLIRPGEQDHQEIMQRADFALSLAREKSGERIHLLASGATPVLEASRQAELLVKVSDAVRNERMRLLFQPIASLRGDRRERYEVLLRLYQDSGEELLAESVFALAQRSSKLGQTLDRWVVAQCLRVLQQGQDSTLFIQLSPATVNDTVWPNWLRERLARSQVAPVRLVFELSEHTARQQQALLPGFAAALRELGCGLALNRFGRHADSMAFIQGLPLHYVKLDSRFVRDLGGGQTVEARQMLHDLVENLGERGVQVIVGGIEELHVLPALWGCGVDLVQGFFLQRPHEEMNYDFAGEVL